MALRERVYEADLECGSTTSEDEGSKNLTSSGSRGKRALSRVCSGFLSTNGPIKGETDNDSSNTLLNSIDVSGGRVELLIERNLREGESGEVVALLGENSDEKCKKPNSKRAPKPPRPPKGPSLDSADLKLVRELSALAAKKRARIERMRALRKMKATKGSSSGSNVTAMFITVIFFLVIMLQGFCCRNNFSRGFQGSPEPAVATQGLISIRLYDSLSNKMHGPASQFFNSPKQALGSVPRREDGRDIG